MKKDILCVLSIHNKCHNLSLEGYYGRYCMKCGLLISNDEGDDGQWWERFLRKLDKCRKSLKLILGGKIK